MINFWIIHFFANGNTLALLDFKKSVTRVYLHLSSNFDSKNFGRSKVFSLKLIPKISLYTTGHSLDRTEEGKRRKYASFKKKILK